MEPTLPLDVAMVKARKMMIEPAADEADPCAVCLLKINRDSLFDVVIGCRHVFHTRCMLRVLAQSNSSCPCCRGTLSTGVVRARRSREGPWVLGALQTRYAASLANAYKSLYIPPLVQVQPAPPRRPPTETRARLRKRMETLRRHVFLHQDRWRRLLRLCEQASFRLTQSVSEFDMLSRKIATMPEEEDGDGGEDSR